VSGYADDDSIHQGTGFGMVQQHTSGNFTAFSTTNWRQLMRLADLVSILIDHDKKVPDGDLIKGQAEVGDRLFAMIEELSLDCIQRGMGREVAIALQRLSAPLPTDPTDVRASAPDSTRDSTTHSTCASAATMPRSTAVE
jgi:hypothetical protein